ncbi:MAG TPA: hypothetical protein VL137_03025 [Polyangiaceae bacterium]|jgi:hypothetical protein|nr:hypothetical protein [Polyangiaceae bacterium]
MDSSSTLLGFRDEAASATIAVNGRCGKDADDVPLQSLTQHLFLQFTEKHPEGEQLIQLAGREALRSELSATLDGVPKHFIVVVLKKDGCVYDFLYISRDAPASADVAEFDTFVQGFVTLD